MGKTELAENTAVAPLPRSTRVIVVISPSPHLSISQPTPCLRASAAAISWSGSRWSNARSSASAALVASVTSRGSGGATAHAESSSRKVGCRLKPNGAGGQNRTDNPRFTKAVLYR